MHSPKRTHDLMETVLYFLFTWSSLPHSSPINAVPFPTDVENTTWSCIKEVRREIAKAQIENAFGLQNIDQFQIFRTYLKQSDNNTRKYGLSCDRTGCVNNTSFPLNKLTINASWCISQICRSWTAQKRISQGAERRLPPSLLLTRPNWPIRDLPARFNLGR